MDALDLLEHQHREVIALSDRITAAVSPGHRTSLVIELVRAIEAHSRVEERYFYPAFRARIGELPGLYEAYEHHALMRFAAVNLLRTRATDVRFTARLKLVQELFHRHAAAEEDWGFPKAKRNLTDEALDVIGTEVAQAHQVLMLAGVFGTSARRAASPQRPHRAHRRRERAQPSRSRATLF